MLSSKKNLYIGLMSGTSIDGIDAALVNFESTRPKLIATYYRQFPENLYKEIFDLTQSGTDEINRLGKLDVLLGKEFANTVNQLLQKTNLTADDITAIGSHGQTIRHHPNREFTIQIGDPNIIVAKTNITTVADFRRRDIALGGQGAPLVPAFHKTLFAVTHTNRIVLNIGGIANITLLPTDKPVSGFDTGPGNALIDAWIKKHLDKSYDEKGEWGAQGNPSESLLKNLLSDPYFQIDPPKSTGIEYFNLNWLEKYLSKTIKPEDVQATLVELTACSIINAIKKYGHSGEILVCGGGVHNSYLMNRLDELAKPFAVYTTNAFDIDPDAIEAMAFAWLAHQTLNRKTSNITAVTGAEKDAILGGIYYA